MPSYSKIMSEALAEDKFDKTFSAFMDDRIESMNNAQLTGIRQYLEPTVKRSKFASWRNANAKVLSKVDEILSSRLYEIEAEVLKEEKLDTKVHDKVQRKENKIEAKRHMLAQTAKNARRTAEKEVTEYEAKRKQEEKAHILQNTPIAEETRYQWIYFGVVVFIFGIALASTLFQDALTLSLSILSVLGATGFIFYKAYHAGIIVPKVVTDEEIEDAINIREEEIYLKALNVQKQKAKEHKAAMEADREYRKNQKAIEAEKKMIADAIMHADLDDLNTHQLEENKVGEFEEAHITHNYIAKAYQPEPEPEKAIKYKLSVSIIRLQCFDVSGDDISGCGIYIQVNARNQKNFSAIPILTTKTVRNVDQNGIVWEVETVPVILSYKDSKDCALEFDVLKISPVRGGDTDIEKGELPLDGIPKKVATFSAKIEDGAINQEDSDGDVEASAWRPSGLSIHRMDGEGDVSVRTMIRLVRIAPKIHSEKVVESESNDINDHIESEGERGSDEPSSVS
jgi:hypothetical protein